MQKVNILKNLAQFNIYNKGTLKIKVYKYYILNAYQNLIK